MLANQHSVKNRLWRNYSQHKDSLLSLFIFFDTMNKTTLSGLLESAHSN